MDNDVKVSSFSSNENVVEKKVKLKETGSKSNISFEERFDIKGCVEFIEEGKYKSVALQFSDDLLSYSDKTMQSLKLKTKADVFILGDTSFGSCCIDEVAASHLNGDCIIHFGPACLSPNKKLPVFYVFDKFHINVENFCEGFIKTFNNKEHLDKQIMIISDVEYNHCMGPIKEILSKKWEGENNIYLCEVSQVWNKPPCDNCSCDVLKENNKRDLVENEEDSKYITKIFSRDIKKMSGGDQKLIAESFEIVFLGDKHSQLLQNLVLGHNSNKIYVYDDSEENQKDSVRLVSNEDKKGLIKRYFLIEKIKDATTVGILVLTLSLKDSLQMIQNVKNLVKNAGKKYYMFVIGKLNVQKLLNFAHIDCFVVISCPFNSVKDSKKFLKPLATPFELQVALGAREWSGSYSTEFSPLLNTVNEVPENSDDEEDPHISLFSQTIIEKKSKDTFHNENKNNQIVIASRQDIMRISPASYQLSKREFKGLDPTVQDLPVELAIQGPKGIAMGYDNEPVQSQLENNKKDPNKKNVENNKGKFF
eukprot:TRINITY_DN3203_c0_g1_i2.p1 TRINITY_DN3203_c0_g1~~TRINITY_DN3203_c0_g1_i2.p1  ORF type:complete len:535 (+),score=169.99 TRINITY_DN3203_c0_g1_i2:2-1606(+)